MTEPSAEYAGRCECDFDPAFHRVVNARLGRYDDPTCHVPAADHSPVVASPALCMGCLFGCAS